MANGGGGGVCVGFSFLEFSVCVVLENKDIARDEGGSYVK